MIQFNEKAMTRVNEIIARYPEGKQKSALLPVLHMAQQEFGGWLDVSVMDYVASLLQIKPIEVYEVASFYSMFNLKPVGKHVFEVCQTVHVCSMAVTKSLIISKTNSAFQLEKPRQTACLR